MPGRGGAGNIQASQSWNAGPTIDLEANQQAAERLTTPIPRSTESEYAHTGRGGAGNYCSPTALNEQGTFSNTTMTYAVESDSTKTQEGAAMRTYGRGGAGNYMFNSNEMPEKAMQREEEQSNMRQKLQADIERGVADSLAMPPKARVAGGRSQ